MTEDASDEPTTKEIVGEAFRQFHLEGFCFGVVIDHAWFYAALQVPNPDLEPDGDKRDVARLMFMSRFKRLGQRLLLDSKIMLLNVYGQGYRVIPPSEQTAVARSEMSDELSKAFTKASARIRHVNIHALTTGERAENINAITNLRHLRELIRKDSKGETPSTTEQPKMHVTMN